MTDDLDFICPECKSPIKHVAGMTMGEVLSLRHNSQHQAVRIDVLKMDVSAKDARIAELEAQLFAGNDWLNARSVVLQDLAEAQARIAELEAALKPFADTVPVIQEDDHGVVYEWALNCDDLRAARAALEKKNESSD